jgi:hypothetical protein
MSIEIRLPNITGVSEKEQLLQLKSYLYQLSEQLQWAFDNINTTGGSGNGYVVNQAPIIPSVSSGGNAQATFSEIKSLIIKSAEIVDAYYEEINKRLEGLYVAQSDFGIFAEKTSQDIEATSTAITQTFENTQIIIRETKDEIEGELTVMGQDLSYAQQDVIVLKGNVEDINSNLSSVEANIGELDTALQNTKVEVNGNIDSAKSELSGTIESAKGELNSNIDNAVSNANAYTDAAESAAKGYTDEAASNLDGKIGETASELDGKIVDTNGRIDETNGALEDLGSGLDDTNSRIDGVDKDLQDSKTNITTEIQRVTDSVSAVDKLRLAAEEALRGSIDDLEFDLAGLKQIVVGVTAYVKSGKLYETDAGIPVYGIEIGQEVEANGTTVFNKFARFTSEKLSFYDANGNEVAYISDKKLYIGQAEITISFKMGKLIDLVQANGDVVTKWEGG